MSIKNELEPLAAKLNEELRQNHEAREFALGQCRKVIQASSKSIRCTHRHDFDGARTFIAEARSFLAAIRDRLSPHPAIYYAGYLQDAEKEAVEAEATLAILTGAPLPLPESMGVAAVAYLHGLAEAASEARRFILDQVRAGDAAKAEAVLDSMESVYECLIGFDYPDGLTNGLRRTVDALRAVLERTRSDLALTFAQDRLIGELKNAQDLLTKVNQTEG